MPLKDDLLRRGYLPENLPPAFTTEQIADYFKANASKGFLSDTKYLVRPAIYNASKRGMTRRNFSLVHPVTAHDLSEFSEARWDQLAGFFNKGRYSLSVPKPTPEGDRALEIGSHTELEAVRLTRLSRYRFIAKTDISRFYHSVYTHSIPWAFHGRKNAKADRNPRSNMVFCNRADHILRCGQDGQTIGIPVGPDASRLIAEVICTAIDLEFQNRCKVSDYAVLRHVDDVWIGANSHADAEDALWRYRESIREFELDINEAKTRIYAEDFRFSDGWPTEVASQLEFAIEADKRRAPERLRAALEHAFSLTATGSDDGVLKYAIRYLDQSDQRWKHWDTIEPFLKRAAVHFGHTVDYVTRVIVWRYLTQGEFDRESWSAIFLAILDRQGRLGNDSEVCWAIYACMRLEIKISREIAENILANCGALSALAIMNCVELKLVDTDIFSAATAILSQENAAGHYWPVLLEWLARKWPNYKKLSVDNDLIEAMSAKEVKLFNPQQLPRVFRGLDEASFGDVVEAIERRVSFYDDENEGEDDDDENDDQDEGDKYEEDDFFEL